MLNLLDDICSRTARIRSLRSERDRLTEELHAEEIAVQRIADQAHHIRMQELKDEKK